MGVGFFADNGLANVFFNKNYGYINASGKFVIKPQFESASAFSNGLASVQNNNKWGYINESGNIVIKSQYEEARMFADNGLAVVKFNGKYGYIDKSGSFVIAPQFDYAWDFFINDKTSNSLNIADNGLTGAFIRQSDKHIKGGYINKNGQFVIPPYYEEMKEFTNDGFAQVRLNGNWIYIDTSGASFTKSQYSSSNKLSPAKLNGKFGYINKLDKIVIPPIFDYAHDFAKNGLAAVVVNDKYGFVNQSGKFVITPEFENIELLNNESFFYSGLAKVTLNGKEGYINETGKWISDYVLPMTAEEKSAKHK